MRRAYNKLVAAFAASLDVALVSLRAPLEPAFELAYRRALARECGCDAAYTQTIRGKSRQAAALGARSCGRYPPPEGPRSHLTTTTTATTTATTTNVSRSIPLCLFLARLPPAGHQSITRSLLIIYRRQSRRIAIKCARLPSKPPPPDPITL